MTRPTVAAQLLWEAAAAARLAPSIHNTQPWRFVLIPDALQIHADRDRQLRVADPDGRQLMLSCGCALFNARATLAARGYDAVVSRLPDPDDPGLVARLGATGPAVGLGADRRARTAHRPAALQPRTVPGHLRRSPRCAYELAPRGRAGKAELFEVREQAHRLEHRQVEPAGRPLESTDPAYRQELTAWTTGDPRRKDGVPAMAVPYRSGTLAASAMPCRSGTSTPTGWAGSTLRTARACRSACWCWPPPPTTRVLVARRRGAATAVAGGDPRRLRGEPVRPGDRHRRPARPTAHRTRPGRLSADGAAGRAGQPRRRRPAGVTWTSW